MSNPLDNLVAIHGAYQVEHAYKVLEEIIQRGSGWIIIVTEDPEDNSTDIRVLGRSLRKDILWASEQLRLYSTEVKEE